MTVRTHPNARARRLSSRLRVHPETVALIVSASVAVLVGLLVGMDSQERVERLEIRNDTDLRLTVSVGGASDWGATPIAYVWPGRSDVAVEFPDHGSTWLVHLQSERDTSAVITVSRADLAQAGWILRISPELSEMLRE